ncbi:hypothetical protein D9756_000418 [Leucocoprinus leucothites]|uniref:Bromo domain-containing protein n=1 Tax=Leucocoprinus leucothites TaxID=201217 RepID=A0A8H5GF24_9AGAR|nr:hypothetical protein D9756_000418 [Leucoagaricus leucothites]
MTTRSGKRATAAETQQPSHLEALLLAQGAWEMGASPSTWAPIAKILSKHPLVNRPKSFFTPQSCHSMYNSLMQDAGLDVIEECSSPQSSINLALAKKHYDLRFEELHRLILAEEHAFRTILKEIEDIKTGKWDEQLQSKVTGQASTNQESALADTLPTASAETGGDEAFSGSDLSGVTETSSPSQTREGSETPTLARLGDDTPTKPQTEQEPPQTTEDEVKKQTTPTASSMVGSVEVETEKDILNEETLVDSSAADDSVMADGTVASTDGDGAEQPRREEEEEEEDTTTKPEEEETDHEGNEVEVGVEQSVLEEQTMSAEHQPEEEEEEEEIRDASQHPEENEVEHKQLEGDEANSPSAEDQEDQEASEGTRQQVESEASDEEPAQVTRRSTRNKTTVPAAPVTRKTRRQTRASEPDVQSDAENADGAETPQEERASSPLPVEPIGTRRRKRKSSVPEPVESPRDRKRQRDESEPLDDDEPGPSTGGRRRRGDRSEEQLALKKFQNVIGMLHSQISQHRNGNIFHNPIRTVEAPDYHDIVKRPMDLKTIKARVKDGLITNSLEYQRDCFLMFANAMMYNRPGSDVYHMAEDMMHDSEGYINAFRQTEGLVRNRP